MSYEYVFVILLNKNKISDILFQEKILSHGILASLICFYCILYFPRIDIIFILHLWVLELVIKNKNKSIFEDLLIMVHIDGINHLDHVTLFKIKACLIFYIVWE